MIGPARRMLRGGLALRAMALVALLATAGLADEERPLAPGTLSGKLVDPDGKPVVGARVWTSNLDLSILGRNGRVEARSDAEGRFRLGPLEPAYQSDYVLSFEADGLVAPLTPRGAFSVYVGLDHDLGVFPLERGRVFTGLVRDADGTPRPQAPVTFKVVHNIRGHTVSDSTREQSVPTDLDGRFRTPPLPVGRLGVAIDLPGRMLTNRSASIRPGGEEDLGVFTLENDMPVAGSVVDEVGSPVAGARISARGRTFVTDDRGSFTIQGFGPNPTFQMNVTKPGHVQLVGTVRGTDAGVRYDISQPIRAPGTPGPALVVTLGRAGTIEGEALDAATGAPVRVSRVVVAGIERGPDGNVNRVAPGRQYLLQNEPGRFRASFFSPGEYRLTLSAPGYQDAEVFAPKVDEIATIEGLVARLSKRQDVPPAARRTIAGAVTRDGQPVRQGWVALWRVGDAANPPNAPVLRGRMVATTPDVIASAPIRDGSYTLDVPSVGPSYYLVVEEPGRALAQVGPVAIGAGEARKLDIACPPGGEIRGHVPGVPAEWAGRGFVVAFGRTGIQAEARVTPAGDFILPPLPAGEYGLKVGHDAYEDPEVYPGTLAQQHREAFQQVADPWKQAKVVAVGAGETVSGVEVVWPE